MKNKLGKFLCILLGVIFMSGLLQITVVAGEEMRVKLNDEYLKFDVPPQIMDERTMVPMRGIFEALGADVEWYPETRVVEVTRDETVIQLQIDSTRMVKNGQSVSLDVPPQIIDGRTLVPARAVAEALDADVQWDRDSNTVLITVYEENSSETEQVTELMVEMGETGKQYILTEAIGRPKLLSSADSDWSIAIPEPYELVLDKNGNNIFKKNDSTEKFSVKIRITQSTNILEGLSKEISELLRQIDENGKITMEKENVNNLKINGLEYYTIILKPIMEGSSENFYIYCYFAIWDEQLFTFACETSSKTIPKEFEDIVKSFNPKKVSSYIT